MVLRAEAALDLRQSQTRRRAHAPTFGLDRAPPFRKRFLTLRLGGIGQRHILKIFARELIYAGHGVEFVRRGHTSGSGGQLGRMRPQHGGPGGE